MSKQNFFELFVKRFVCMNCKASKKDVECDNKKSFNQNNAVKI